MKKAFSFLLSLLVVCAALPLAPVTAQAFDNYTQAYDAEYYVPASAVFIYQIGLYYSSSSDADAISNIESAGFTPFGGDFNEGAGGKYVHAGYKTTSDPTKALTALRVWDFTAGGDNPDAPPASAASAVGGAACTFYRVGSGASEWTPNVLDDDVNLNQGNSGHHLKLFVTADRSAGLPLASLDTAHSKTAATAYNALLNAGYTVATSFQEPSAYQDLNAGAGSKSDYNYLGYKAAALAAVDSSGLRSVYAAAKDRYENGGSIYSALSSPLTAAAAILADLNDGYTSRTQAQIDDAADALRNARPTFTVTVNGGTASGSVIREGDSVTVTANAPANGQRFREWIGADSLTFTFGSKTTATATFVMPAGDVNLTATYEDNPTHTVTVNGGTASGSAIREGDSVTVTANAPEGGMQFKEWIGADGLTFTSGSKTTATATFIMPAGNVNLTATYEEIVYTVTLNPGDGTGDEIVYISSEQNGFPHIGAAGVNEFYIDDNDEIGFRLDWNNCPSDWTAPWAQRFCGFTDAAEYNTLTQQNTVFTASWVPASGMSMVSSITLDYDSLDADGFLPITLEVYDIDFGEYTPEFIDDSITILLSPGVLTDNNGHELPFHVFTSDHSYSLHTLFVPPDVENRLYDIALKFDPDDLIGAEAGIYTCTWVCSIGWCDYEDVFPGEQEIALQMVKPKVTRTYSVTVTNNGHGTASASPACGTAGTEVTLTATPDDGYRLKMWQVVSGGVTLTGNKFNIRLSDVEIRAVFEEIATSVHTVTITNTEGGTAYASPASGVYGTLVTLTAVPDHGYALKEWIVESGGVTVTNNRFTIGDDDVEIRAVFAEVPDFTFEHPESITVTPYVTHTPLTMTVSELSMITGFNGKTPSMLRVAFNAGTLTDPVSGKTLAFYPHFDLYATTLPSQNVTSFTSTGSKTIYIKIPVNSWNAAEPGVYTGSVSYRICWYYTDKTTSNTLESGTIPITVTIPAHGDVDGDGEVDLGDAVLLTRYIAGGWNVTVNRTVADVNKDGKIDLKDVVLIRRFMAGGWDVELK